MRYEQLGVTFKDPEVWNYDKTETAKGLRWQDIFLGDKDFLEMKTKLKDDLIQTISGPIEEATSEEEIGIYLDPILERLSKSYFCSKNVNHELLLSKANKNTLQKKLNGWSEQLNANVDIVRKSPGVATFFDKMKDVPAVIVAAGPSLKQSIEQIKQLKGKACIIAVDTSFRSCVKRGIEPDFVNAHDANENGQRFFDGIETKTVGVFVNYIHPKTIRAFQGPLSFYYVDDSSIPVYKTMAIACDSPERKQSFLKSKITGGSSVAHTALYFALEMGCNPITFVGLDLSYPDLDKSHFESDNPKSIRGQKLIDVEDIQGRTIKTNLSFYSYKVVFERMLPILAGVFGAKFYTSSQDENGKPAGVVHCGLEPISLADFAELYCREERQELKNIQEVYKNGY